MPSINCAKCTHHEEKVEGEEQMKADPKGTGDFRE
jgi:hypothetical protein